ACLARHQGSLRFEREKILRVLKPGGKLVFIEHVAAPAGTWLRRLQNWVTPVWKRMGDGCPSESRDVDRTGAGRIWRADLRQLPGPIPDCSRSEHGCSGQKVLASTFRRRTNSSALGSGLALCSHLIAEEVWIPWT